MLLRQYIPRNAHPLVSAIWEMASEPGEPLAPHPVPPIGCPELLFFLRRPSGISGVEAPRCIVKGQYRHLQAVAFDGPYHLLILRLHAPALHELLGIDCATLQDGYRDGDAYTPVAALADILCADGGLPERLVRALDLLSALPRKPISDTTRRFLALVEGAGSNGVSRLIHNQGIGLRTLQRVFAREVGLGPKKFLQIRRLLQLQAGLSAATDWLQVVSEFEFADQSHLVREFKQFLGHSPGEFVRNRVGLKEVLPPAEGRDL